MSALDNLRQSLRDDDTRRFQIGRWGVQIDRVDSSGGKHLVFVFDDWHMGFIPYVALDRAAVNGSDLAVAEYIDRAITKGACRAAFLRMPCHDEPGPYLDPSLRIDLTAALGRVR